MKKLIFAVLCLFGVLFAQETFKNYQKNPSPDTFSAAYKALSEADSSDVRSALMLNYLLVMEKNRQLDDMLENSDNYDQGVWFGLGNLLLSEKRYSDAIKLYEKCNNAAPEWSCPWRHKGEALMEENKLDEAIIALKKAIETRATHFDAYVMLAMVYKEKGDVQNALIVLEKGLPYKGQDIEEGESFTDEKMLHLELLKANNKNYKSLLDELKKERPGDENLKNY